MESWSQVGRGWPQGRDPLDELTQSLRTWGPQQRPMETLTRLLRERAVISIGIGPLAPSARLPWGKHA